MEEDEDLGRYTVQELEAMSEEVRRVQRELESSWSAGRIEETLEKRSQQLRRVIAARRTE